jgi:hypothetical protein
LEFFDSLTRDYPSHPHFTPRRKRKEERDDYSSKLSKKDEVGSDGSQRTLKTRHLACAKTEGTLSRAPFSFALALRDWFIIQIFARSKDVIQPR